MSGRPGERRGARLFQKLLWGSFWRRRGRWGIALAAVAIGASVAAGLLMVSRDVERQVSRELRVFGPNIAITPNARVVHSGLRELKIASVVNRTTLSDVGPLPGETRAVDGHEVRVDISLPLLYGVAHAIPRAFEKETVLIAGTDLAALDELYSGWRRSPASGTLGGERVAAHIGRDIAKRLDVIPGDTLSLVSVRVEGERIPIRVLSVIDAGTREDEMLFIPLGVAQRLLGLPGRASVHLARAGGITGDIETAVAQGWLSQNDRNVRLLRKMSTAEREILDRLGILLGIITALALAGAALCAWSTLTDLVIERRREVALLKALGAGQLQVLSLFLAEALILGAAGGTLGFLIGIMAAQVIGQSVFGANIRIDFQVFPMVLGAAVGVTVIASVLPVRHALSVQPAAVLRGD